MHAFPFTPMVRALERIHAKDTASSCEEVSILQVLVIGNHSSGKSTFINKLLGKEAAVRLLSSGVRRELAVSVSRSRILALHPQTTALQSLRDGRSPKQRRRKLFDDSGCSRSMHWA